MSVDGSNLPTPTERGSDALLLLGLLALLRKLRAEVSEPGP